MTLGIFELTIVIVCATILGILFRFLKQPIILAYIFTGLLFTFLGVFKISDKNLFETFSQLGVMFLLFLVGLEINYSSLRFLGKISLITGLSQIIFTFGIGFLIIKLFNFSLLETIYLSLALTFSSTIIVIKLLSEKKELNTLYGRISIGLLLIQDLVAIFVLVFLSAFQKETSISLQSILEVVGKAIILFGGMIFFGRKIIPQFFSKISYSQELIFLISVAWCLGVSLITVKSGFSIEIGGFLAGLSLANSSEHFEISSRIKSLRDLFILIFFVILGTSLSFGNLENFIIPFIVLSFFVLIGNTLIVMVIMGLLGYDKKTSFLCGLCVSQISEFSLILVNLGSKLGHLKEEIVVLTTAIGIFTITISTLFYSQSENIYKFLSPYLNIFQRKKEKEKEIEEKYSKPIVLVGACRTGQNILSYLDKEKVLVIEIDPLIVEKLKRKGYDVIFGNVGEPEFLNEINLEKTKVFISTSPEFEDNYNLLRFIKKYYPHVRIIIRAENEKDADIFYKNYADYVILPYLTAGQFIGENILKEEEGFHLLWRFREKEKKVIENILKNENI